MEKIIFAIAQKHFNVDTLQTRNLDRLDFYDVSVASIKAALEDAYQAGKKEKQKKIQIKNKLGL